MTKTTPRISSPPTSDKHRNEANDDTTTVRVAILGAGFAGLTIANYLEQSNTFNDDCDCDGSFEAAATIATTTASTQNRISGNIDHKNVRNNKIHWSCCSFESKPKPLPIIGTIKLPSGRSVFDELGLDWNSMTTGEQHREKQQQQQQQQNHSEYTSEPNVLVPREPVLECLRDRIRNNIRYSCHVVNVTSVVVDKTPKDVGDSSGCKDDDDEKDTDINDSHHRTATQYYIHHTKRKRSSSSHSHHKRNHRKTNDDSKDETVEVFKDGPFDIVIDARGFVLPSLNTISKVNENIHFQIGDCRWQDHVPWYDLGVRRRTVGANIAMKDGLELGKLLVMNLTNTDTDCVNYFDNVRNVHSSLLQSSTGTGSNWSRFKAPSKSELDIQRRRRIALSLIMFPIFLAMACRFIQSFEKI